MRHSLSNNAAIFAALAMISFSLIGLSSCTNKPETLIGTWRGSVNYDGKSREWLYNFYEDGSFKDQALDQNGQPVSGGNGKYSIDSSKVTITWPPESKEVATITWISADELQYVITSHDDEKQIGLKINFRRSAPIAETAASAPAKPEPEKSEKSEIWELVIGEDVEKQEMRDNLLTKAILVLNGNTFELRMWAAKPKGGQSMRGLTGAGPLGPPPDYVLEGKSVSQDSKITLVADSISGDRTRLTDEDKRPLVLTKVSDGTLKGEEGVTLRRVKEE